MNFGCMKHVAWVIFSLLLFPASAFAQYSPDASMDLGVGYGATALGQSTLDGTRHGTSTRPRPRIELQS